MSSPSVNVGGVTATIVGVREEWPEEGPRATVLFQCDYDQRYALAKALRGSAVSVGGAIIRRPPFQYPDSPNLYCMALGEFEPIKERTDQASGWLKYALCRIPAVFSVPPYQFVANDPGGQVDPSGQPWTTTTMNVAAEVLVPPRGTYYFPDGTPLKDSHGGIIIPQCEITFQRHMMPGVPLRAMMKLIGGVNAAEFRVADYTFARGTVMFANGPTRQQADTIGGVTSEVEYKFLARGEDDSGVPIEWNQFLATDGTWKLVNTTPGGGGKAPFKYIDFSTLP